APDGVDWHFVYAEVDGQRRCVESWGELRGGADILREIGYAPRADAPPPKGIFHTRLAWRPERGHAHVTDALGQRRLYVGNALGLVTAYQDPRGYVTQYNYDGAGRLTSIRDAEGRVARRRFDLSGRPLDASVDGEPLRAMTFDDETSSAVVREGGEVTRKMVFQRSRVIEEVDEIGRKMTLAYNESGQLASVQRPDGTTDTSAYDAHGNPSEITAGGVARAAYEFDLFGKPVKITTTKGVTLELDYDSRDYPVAIREPGGKVTKLDHGPTG